MTPSITPAITLPPLRSCLRSAMRSPLLSPAITPAIGVYSIPPYPPVGSKPSRAAPGTARASRIRSPLRWRSACDRTLRPPQAWWGRGPKGPHCRLHKRNEEYFPAIDRTEPKPLCRPCGLNAQAIGTCHNGLSSLLTLLCAMAGADTVQAHARTAASGPARLRDSLPALALRSTAANAKTHQRAPQRVRGCRGYPRRFPSTGCSRALRGNAVRCQCFASLRTAISLCHCHIGRDLPARSTNNPRKLDERARGRARGIGQSPASQPTPSQMLPGCWQKTRRGWGGSRNQERYHMFTYQSPFAAAPKNSGGSPLQSLSDIAGH